jgi:hypothetical protein
MSKLNSQEQLFVLCFFENGGNQGKALETAGFDFKNRNTRDRLAHYYIHKKEIMEAIKEESQRRTVMLAPKVQAAIEALVDNPQHEAHFKALKMARDDAGISRAVERVLNVNVTVTDQEKLEAIKLFAKNHGIDPKKFLGYDPEKVEDAEFSELTPEEEDKLLGIS